jgi:hypothetical protein
LSTGERPKLLEEKESVHRQNGRRVCERRGGPAIDTTVAKRFISKKYQDIETILQRTTKKVFNLTVTCHQRAHVVQTGT